MLPQTFPILYHAHHQRYIEDLPFWIELAAQHAGPILELGCGTGRVLQPLADAGQTVVGLDHDPAMLAFLREHLSDQVRSRVQLVEADLRHFELKQRFGLILLPCNTYSTFDAAARAQALQSIRKHLLPGGSFALSLPNPAVLAEIEVSGEPEVEETFAHPISGDPVQVSSAWYCTDQAMHLYWHYDHLLPGGAVERSTASVVHQILPLSTYLAEFQAAGLPVVKRYGDFARRPYRRASPYLILIAQAPKSAAGAPTGQLIEFK